MIKAHPTTAQRHPGSGRTSGTFTGLRTQVAAQTMGPHSSDTPKSLALEVKGNKRGPQAEGCSPGFPSPTCSRPVFPHRRTESGAEKDLGDLLVLLLCVQMRSWKFRGAVPSVPETPSLEPRSCFSAFTRTHAHTDEEQCTPFPGIFTLQQGSKNPLTQL